MSWKRWMLAAVVAAIGLGMTSGASAAPVPLTEGFFDVARGAGTFMHTGNSLFASVDAGMDSSSFSLGKTETFVCATVVQTIKSSTSKGALVDVGCAKLPVVVDPALRTARVSGGIRSRYVDARNGKQVSWSRLYVDLTWTGSGLPTPFAGNFEQSGVWGSSPFVFLDLGAGMVRGAVASGSVTSARLGRVAEKTTDALLFDAAEVGVGTYF